MKALSVLLLSLALSACGPATTPGGTSGQLDALRGQWLVINYWAIWCKPCIREIPELNALAKLPGVTVLGVNFDGESGEELKQQVQKLGIEFATLDKDPAGELGTERPLVLPTTLVIDPAGQLRDTLVGPQTLASLAAATGREPPAESAH